MRYKITIQYDKQGHIIKEETLTINSHKEPKVGETTALLCDPPIYKTITNVEYIPCPECGDTGRSYPTLSDPDGVECELCNHD